ncbi:SpoIIE family protein phosphatase [Yinghuangia seranimata]|uniref:SpoIIE family protein phosphatase n=1 Tax=Yinghuangia seranimata TaxID=408067 RepID=UPI00248B5345|nr:SpoIIE family protein phosphatase [Yinghuangia seranimata]MDI2129646.1 SpoIIE family protein phosphatase [Yinghuangia seranimata]
MDGDCTARLLVDEAGAVTAVVPAGAEVGGRALAPWVGRPLVELFAVESAEQVTALVKRADGVPVPQLVLAFSADGDHHHVWAVAHACATAHGAARLVAVTVGEGTHGTGSGTPPFMLWCADPATRAASADATANHAYGLPPGVRMDYADFLTRVHPDDVTVVLGLEHRATDLGGRSVQSHLRLRGDDGVWRWLLVRAATHRLGGRLVLSGVCVPLAPERAAGDGAHGDVDLVYRASDSLIRTSSRDEVLDLLLHTFPPLLRATQSTVALGDGTRLHMHRVPQPAAGVEAPRLVSLDAPHPVAVTARTGQDWFLTVEQHDALAEETAPLVAAPGTRAWWMLPLPDATGRTVGAWTLGFPDPHRPAPEAQAAIREVTRMAGHALARAGETQPYLDFVEAFRAGTEFERPSGLPPGIEAAVRHRPAHEAADLGGDWYDIFALSGGLVALAVGDVQGHGPEAAPMMSRLRTLLRAYALDYRDPGMVLTRVNDFLDRFPAHIHATCLMAYLDTGTGELVASSAGHPPLLVANPDGVGGSVGSVTVLETPCDTPPLGVVAEQRYASTRLAVPVGGTVALCTDGLLEGPRLDLDEGVTRLARDLAEHVAAPLEDAAGTMFARADETGHRDDATLLLARRPVPVAALTAG